MNKPADIEAQMSNVNAHYVPGTVFSAFCAALKRRPVLVTMLRFQGIGAFSAPCAALKRRQIAIIPLYNQARYIHRRAPPSS